RGGQRDRETIDAGALLRRHGAVAPGRAQRGAQARAVVRARREVRPRAAQADRGNVGGAGRPFRAEGQLHLGTLPAVSSGPRITGAGRAALTSGWRTRPPRPRSLSSIAGTRSPS